MYRQKEIHTVSDSYLSIKALRSSIFYQRIYYFAKRVMDVVVSLSLLILLSPVMLLAGLAIFIYSPGPVFFVQKRVGAKRHIKGDEISWEQTTFSCYKFRTMKVNADSSVHREYIKALIENDHEQMQAVQEIATRPRKDGKSADENMHKLVDDARIIPPGKFLRKFSIDELPQFWNVLRGDMSLIGPRPSIPYEVEMYKPWHMGRLQAQPGITGLQQVVARCTATFDEQVELDIDYVENQSLWLDLKIAVKTPLAIIMAKGAH